MTEKQNTNKLVTVYGAYGHTGKFVVAELVKRGYSPILSGRSHDQLHLMGSIYPNLEIRPASIEDPDSLDVALDGAMAVINCAGPFLDTAPAIIKAALRKGVNYLDVTAEQASVLNTYERFHQEAQDKGIIVMPAMAFYGGLADLLATAAMGDWITADSVNIAIALNSWLPTAGTRLTGQRNNSRRLIFSNRQLTFISDKPVYRNWHFRAPFGMQDVIDIPFSEIITISRHLQVDEINTCINVAPMNDIRNSETPPPAAADDSGRSSQIFLMEVEVRYGDEFRKSVASGRDIYAITAPLVVEATIRIAERPNKKKGVLSPAEACDAVDFLTSLSSEHLLIDNFY